MGSEVLSEASQPGGGIEARVAGVEEVAWGVVDVDEDRVVLAWSAGPEHRRVVVDEGEEVAVAEASSGEVSEVPLDVDDDPAVETSASDWP